MTDADRNLLGAWAPWIVVIVLFAVAGGVIAIVRESKRDGESADLAKAFVYDVDRYRIIPPERIGYRQIDILDTGLERTTALAVGPRDRIVVGGDRKVLVLAPNGSIEETIPTGDTPLALATTPDGELFVAFERTVVRGKLSGSLEEFLTIPGKRTRITSIAADRDSVYVADYGGRRVLRFDLNGDPIGTIGDRDRERDIPGFNVPSPYFDLLVAPDGLLRIVDPGRHRITAFTTGGDLELAWGKASFELEGFNGCCNPSHIALFADGRFVTSEKGIPRVKVYDADGTFVTAVVGADGLSTETEPCEVGTDSSGRILVLDPGESVVRIFTAKGGPDRED